MAETWRDRMRPLVGEVVESGRAAGLEGRKLLTYCQRSYPWGNHVGFHGRRIWCSECRVQLKMKTPAEMREIESRPTPLFDGEEENG